jgi:valyl-tRNA synthetase
MATRWPEAGATDEAAEADAEWLKTVISAIRSARTELGLAPGKPMPLMVQLGENEDHERLERFGTLIRRLARIESIERVDDQRDSADSAVALAGNLRLLIPLAGLVDIGEEVARLNKQLERERKGLAQAEKKLANERFVENAPAEVVDKERQRLEDHKGKVAELAAQIKKLEQLG